MMYDDDANMRVTNSSMIAVGARLYLTLLNMMTLLDTTVITMMMMMMMMMIMYQFFNYRGGHSTLLRDTFLLHHVSQNLERSLT
jgi:hypothetical protein